MIRVHNSLSIFTRRMSRKRRQIPFATANALTSTAFAVRRRIIGHSYPAAFTVRNKGFARAAFRVDKATKRKLVARVFDRLGRSFLVLQAKGGTKRARGGGRLAVPSRRVQRTASGRIRPGQLPSAVLAKAGGYVGTVARSTEAIWRTTRTGLQLLYSLVPTARVRKRFKFFEDAKRTARKVFPVEFRKAFRRAVKTAR